MAALTHFQVFGNHRDSVIRANANKRIGRKQALFQAGATGLPWACQFSHLFGMAFLKIDSQCQATGGCSNHLEKLATAGIHWISHGVSPPYASVLAASLIAALIL